MLQPSPEITNCRYLLTFIYLATCVRSKESPSIPVATQDNLEPILPLCSIADQHQKQKDEILGSPCVPQLLNKTRNIPPCHFTTLLPFPPCHLTTLAPFPHCHLPTLSPSHLSQLATSLPSNLAKVAALLSSNLSNLPSLLPSHLSHLPISLPSHLSHLPNTLPFHLSYLLKDHSKITFFH